MRCRVVFVVLAVLAIWATNTAVAAAAGELTFVEPENVAATYKQGRTNEVSVWLENGSTQEVTPRFTTVLEGKGGEAAAAEVEVVGEGAAGGRAAASIAAGQVARYRLVFVDPSKSNGQLVAGAPGLKPATLPLSLAPNLSSTRGINAALIIPAIFAFALWVVALDIAIIPAVFGCGIGFLGKMGPLAGLGFRAELDFSKSFASTLTGVGALLGTIIGAGVLPTETVAISRGGFVGLNLTFGVAIVVAGALSGALLRPKVFDNTKEQTKEWKVEGYLWAFIASTLITLWAVFG